MTDSRDHSMRRKAAAQWFADLQDPEVCPETWETFLEWEKDPRNAAAFREIEAAVDLIDRSSLGQSEPGQQVQKGRTHTPTRRQTGAWLITAAAAAAVISIVSIAFIRSGPQLAPQTYTTAVGEQLTVALKDGSRLTLNTDTKLDVSYSSKVRLIRLVQGQALFEVEKSDRPFLVEAGGTRTRALGTEFDVHAEAGEVSITLLEGSVLITSRNAAAIKPLAAPAPGNELGTGIELKPGEQLYVPPGKLPIVRTVNISAMQKWREGIVQFDNVTLADAVEEMNRYATIKIRIDDSELASERISGTFPAGKQKAFADSLQLYLPVEIQQLGNEIHLTHKTQ